MSLARLLREPLILLDQTFGTRRAFDAEVSRSAASYELAAEVGVPEIAQAFAAAGRGVAVLTDEPAYGLHAVRVTGAEGRLRIRLHAVWTATHYAAGTIREFAEALAAYWAVPSVSSRAAEAGGAQQVSPDQSDVANRAAPRAETAVSISASLTTRGEISLITFYCRPIATAPT